MGWFQERQKQSLIILVIMIAGMAYYASRSPADSPRARVEKVIRELVEAAENKDLGPFRKYFSDQVRDESGRNKQELITILRGIFFRHPNIELHLISLDLDDNTNPDVMSASLSLLMGETLLPEDKGNFFLTFRQEEGQWRVWEVKWQEGYGSEF